MKSRKLANKFWLGVGVIAIIAVFCLAPFANLTVTPSAAATNYDAPSYLFSKNWYEELGVVDYNEYLHELQATSSLRTVTVAVIDSGLDYNSSPIFKGRVNTTYARNFNYSNYRTADDWQQDESGHGTHVAGIIAAGSMANVQILPIRIFVGESNSMTFSAFHDAINHVIRYAKMLNIVAVNLSLGTTGITDDQDEQAFNAAFKKDLDTYQPYINSLRNAGILPVAAAGNIDTKIGETGSKSYYAFPASCEGAVSVSAYYRDKNGAAERASFSYYNKRVSLSAPGLEIWSACCGAVAPTADTKLWPYPAGGKNVYYYKTADDRFVYLREHTDDDGKVFYDLRLQGTSMATPFVTLCYALLCSDPSKTTVADWGVEWDATVDTKAPYFYLNARHKALLLNATDFYLENEVGQTDVYFGYGGVNVKAFARADVTSAAEKDPGNPSVPAYKAPGVATDKELENWASVFWILVGMTLVMALVGFLRGMAVHRHRASIAGEANEVIEDDDE